MDRVISLGATSVGKKILMAGSGIVLVLFVIGHMAGNLKAYLGPQAFNDYAHFLRTVGHPLFPEGVLLWIARLVLLFCLGVHLWAAVATWLQSRAARAVGYKVVNDLSFSYASRTMRWGGVILLLFVVYHLLHLTTGTAHPSFHPDDPYYNFVTGFQSWPASIAYVVAMVPLALHLYHGVWSATQTLALTNPRVEPWRRPLAAAIAGAVFAGNVSFPLAVLAGVIR